jgi:hypothetical protein
MKASDFSLVIAARAAEGSKSEFTAPGKQTF